jgi:hypothetical protein
MPKIATRKRRAARRSRQSTGNEAEANAALEDGFPEAFKNARGKVDAGLKLGFSGDDLWEKPAQASNRMPS